MLPDTLSIPMAAFQLAFSAVVSLTLWRLTAWQRRTEGLEARLHEATGRLVDERFRAVTARVDEQSRSVLARLEEVAARLAADERRLADLADRDLKIELALAARLESLKDSIRDYACGKADLDRCEAAMDRRLRRIEAQLCARCGDREEAATRDA